MHTFDHPVLSAWVGDAELAEALSFEAELAAMLRFEAALAAAQAEHDVIPHAAAKAIGRACSAFRPDMEQLRDGTRQDGVIVPALLAQLRQAASGEVADYLHYGATSQDVVDTGLTLRLGSVLDLFARRLGRLTSKLDDLETTFGNATLMGYTRLRAALPITVADRIANWREPIKDSRAALGPLRTRVLVVQFGGPVGTLEKLGPSAAAVRATLAERLGLGDPGECWHVRRARLVELGHWLAGVATACGKIGADLGLMAQDGIGTAALAGGASSSMAHKVNPVDAELLVALSHHAATLLGGLHQAALHENERSGAAWTLEWLILPPLLMSTGASLCAAERILGAVTALGEPAEGPGSA